MKRPWMPLYIADYLADTTHLNTAEHGAYLLLIMHYWTKGHMPYDEDMIRRITRMTTRQWSQSRDLLRSLFEDEWRHKRCDIELAKAIEKSSINSANAVRSHEVRRNSAPEPHIRSQTPSLSDSSKKAKPSSRARDKTALPTDFKLSQVGVDFALSKGFSVTDIQSEFERFCDSAIQHNRRYADWEAAWRNWVTSPFQKSNGVKNGTAKAGSEIIAAADRNVSDARALRDEVSRQSNLFDGESPSPPRPVPPGRSE